jgi:hypothetical protein
MHVNRPVGLDPVIDVYKFDPNFKENEAAYAEIKHEILGSDDEDASGDEEMVLRKLTTLAPVWSCTSTVPSALIPSSTSLASSDIAPGQEVRPRPCPMVSARAR